MSVLPLASVTGSVRCCKDCSRVIVKREEALYFHQRKKDAQQSTLSVLYESLFNMKRTIDATLTQYFDTLGAVNMMHDFEVLEEDGAPSSIGLRHKDKDDKDGDGSGSGGEDDEEDVCIEWNEPGSEDDDDDESESPMPGKRRNKGYNSEEEDGNVQGRRKAPKESGLLEHDELLPVSFLPLMILFAMCLFSFML